MEFSNGEHVLLNSKPFLAGSSCRSPRKADGWNIETPVIIAAIHLPVRVYRTTPMETQSTSKAVDNALGEEKTTPECESTDKKEPEAEEASGLRCDSTARPPPPPAAAAPPPQPFVQGKTAAASSKWRVEWASNLVIEMANTFSHHEISSQMKVKFVGRLPDNLDASEEDVDEIERLLSEIGCYAIHVSKREAKLFYEDYCKLTLWPVFHNVIDLYSPVDVILDKNEEDKDPDHGDDKSLSWTPAYQKQAWQAYANVNQQFAQKICSVYEPGDVIWVQDYHLLLTPSYIVRKIRSANIGLFIHTPFPSSEVFRTLSSRKELLRGMLNADHVGFHLFEYARHFMSCCKRILGLSYQAILHGQIGIDYGGRRVAVTCSHMAIDTKRVENALASAYVRERIVELRRTYFNKKIIAGCDTIERLRGIPLKILAFDAFLSRCPDMIGKCVLIQKGIYRKGRVTDYLQSKKEIEHVVKRINNKYRGKAHGDVIEYEEVKEFGFADRIALWRVADVQLTTVLRDGLNTTPFEYIVARRNFAGVVIVSEFSGSSRLLSGVIAVNPWELDKVIDAIRDAIFMTSAEREQRADGDYQFVCANPPKRWAKCVLSDIVHARKKEDEFVYMGTGFGLDFRLMEVKSTFRKLTDGDMNQKYQHSKSRAIFLDYYRTLAPDVSKVVGVRWPDVPFSVLSTLEQLCKDPHNNVFIVSGCHRDLLTEKFGGVPGLALIAEHGYYIQRAVLGDNARMDRPWERVEDIFPTETIKKKWHEEAKRIIQLYVDRTNGSSLEIRDSAVLFRYGKSDFEFGALQAAELREHLEGNFQGWPLQVIQGKDYIELRPENIGKGKIVGQVLDKMEQEDNPADFVLCIGDDVADELMFDKLNEMVVKRRLREDTVFCCTVGKKPSKATYFVDDITDVIGLVKSLSSLSTKYATRHSLSDMGRFARDPLMYRRSNAHTAFAPHSSLMPVIEEDQSDCRSRSGSNPVTVVMSLARLIHSETAQKWAVRARNVLTVMFVLTFFKWKHHVQRIKEQDRRLLMNVAALVAIFWGMRSAQRRLT